MNKSLVLVSIIATTVLLGACSDSSGPASSTQIQPPGNNQGNTNNGTVTTPTLEGGVSVQTLQSNNGIKASPAQVETDLETLASLGDLSTTIDGFDDIGGDLPILGSASITGQTKRQVALARKSAGLVASGECISADTSYTATENGMETSVKIQWLGANGSPLQICKDDVSSEQEAIALMNNSKVSMEMSGKNDSVSIEMKLLMNINVEGSGESAAIAIDGSAMAMFDMTKPVDFNMYLEMQISMRQEFSSEEEEDVEPEMDVTLWFQDGRYVCETNTTAMEASGEKVCDLKNAGVVVGSLWNDEYGEMIVKDAAGNTVGEDAVINEEL